MNRPHQDKTEEQIRRFQRLVEIQIRKAYAQRNTKALENLQAWDLELQNELLCRN